MPKNICTISEDTFAIIWCPCGLFPPHTQTHNWWWRTQWPLQDQNRRVCPHSIQQCLQAAFSLRRSVSVVCVCVCEYGNAVGLQSLLTVFGNTPHVSTPCCSSIQDFLFLSITIFNPSIHLFVSLFAPALVSSLLLLNSSFFSYLIKKHTTRLNKERLYQKKECESICTDLRWLKRAFLTRKTSPHP